MCDTIRIGEQHDKNRRYHIRVDDHDTRELNGERATPRANWIRKYDSYMGGFRSNRLLVLKSTGLDTKANLRGDRGEYKAA